MASSEIPGDFSKPARNILHPTDFTPLSEVALAHALRLSLSNHAHLDLFHVGPDTDDGWDQFPSIRKLLNRWGIIPEGAAKSAVAELGVSIEKIMTVSENVVDAIGAYCQRHPVDMIVLATKGRDGLASWLKPSTAEQIAEKVSILSIPTLFVPAEGHGCVSMETGAVAMNHVLVPVDHQPSSESAVERGLRAISAYGGEQADLTLLHVGSESSFPNVDVPDGPWHVKRITRKGNPAAEILATAKESQANLIIMVTEGTHGLLDVLRGTTTEQVLRHAPCPVLAVPAQGSQ